MSVTDSPPPRNRAPFDLRYDGSVPIENRGQLWLDDGDLIIVFQVDATAWKVSSGILMNRSHRFRTILLNQPAHALKQEIEGCQMLALLCGEDTAREVQRLLLLLHDRTYAVMVEFSVGSAIMTSYDF